MRLRDGQPCFLSDSFYTEHPHTLYPEIESKRNRPGNSSLLRYSTLRYFEKELGL